MQTLYIVFFPNKKNLLLTWKAQLEEIAVFTLPRPSLWAVVIVIVVAVVVVIVVAVVVVSVLLSGVVAAGPPL